MPYEKEPIPGSEVDRRIDAKVGAMEAGIREYMRFEFAEMKAAIDKSYQASVYTTAMLSGDDTLGLQGVIPEFRNSLNAVHSSMKRRNSRDRKRWVWIQSQLRGLRTRVRKVEFKQGTTHRMLEQLGKGLKWVPWKAWVGGGVVALAEVTPWHPLRNVFSWLAAHWPK